MGRIIFSIVSLVALAVIIVMNAGTSTAFNLFGWQVESVPVVVVAIVSFVVGAVYSFVFYVAGYFARTRKEKLAMQKRQLKTQQETIKSKDATLRAREKEVAAIESAGTAPRQLPPAAGTTTGAGQEPYGAQGAGTRGPATAVRRSGTGFLGRIFGKRTSSGK